MTTQFVKFESNLNVNPQDRIVNGQDYVDRASLYYYIDGPVVKAENTKHQLEAIMSIRPLLGNTIMSKLGNTLFKFTPCELLRKLGVKPTDESLTAESYFYTVTEYIEKYYENNNGDAWVPGIDSWIRQYKRIVEMTYTSLYGDQKREIYSNNADIPEFIL